MPKCFWMIAAILAGLTACQSVDERDDPIAATAISPAAAGAIAGDMASRLAEQLPPQSTSLRMTSDKTAFAVALEAALQGWGYNLDLKQDRKAGQSRPAGLGYSAETVNGQVLARLSTPAITLSRSYAATAEGASPSSPLSVMTTSTDTGERQ